MEGQLWAWEHKHSEGVIAACWRSMGAVEMMAMTFSAPFAFFATAIADARLGMVE